MRKNKNRLMKGLLYGLVVCGVIVISLRLYSMYTICISPDSLFELICRGRILFLLLEKACPMCL